MTDTPPAEQVRVVDAPDKERYEIHVGDDVAGFTEYHTKDGLRVFPHTLVDDAFRGRGLSGQLIGEALERTGAAGLQVLPQCPAVSGYIRKNPEFAELVPPDRRDEFGL